MGGDDLATGCSAISAMHEFCGKLLSNLLHVAEIELQAELQNLPFDDELLLN
ncbi:hypothetical protein COLO4_05298 [Corchorus olitorius]|uniref:Uncharacterized protein n=1 Tax=Corchorus olitorius TaxID=93759 RepID=A0A1R3KR83_9ROSI|nr:hypothetical protein COLO4_05298 [Corchorus olitorius]